MLTKTFVLKYKVSIFESAKPLTFEATEKSAEALAREHARNIYQATNVANFDLHWPDGSITNFYLSEEERMVPVQHD